MATGKRLYRDMSDETKRKISQAMRGRPLDPLHKERISRALQQYWKDIPYRDGAEKERADEGGDGHEERE